MLMNRSLVASVTALVVSTGLQAFAGERLLNGNLESGGAPPGWDLTQIISGEGTFVSATEAVSFGDEDGTGLGLFLKPYAGNRGTFDLQNKGVDVLLSQTVNASPNFTYKFSGSTRWQGDADSLTNDGYSGGVTTLDELSASGAVASPTNTFFRIEFLNASNVVVGTPQTLDLRTSGVLNDNTWFQRNLMTVSPAGTTKVRVTAGGTNMVDNTGSQDVFFDTFSLTADHPSPAIPAVEVLTNRELDIPGAPTNWTLIQRPVGTEPTGQFIAFAENGAQGTYLPGQSDPSPGAVQGLWIRAFAEGDVEITQTVSATAGGTYDFSAWSMFEDFYSGGLGDPNAVTFLRMEFLNGETVLDTSELNLATAGQLNDKVWRQFTLSDIAPASTTDVRVTAGARGLFAGEGNPQSAFIDDLSLIETLVSAGLPGDYNDDGMVDAADYTVWRDNLGGNSSALNGNGTGAATVVQADYDHWKTNFGSTAFGGGIAAAGVPEPATLTLGLLALGLAGRLRRRVA